jgi:hypothetical protein
MTRVAAPAQAPCPHLVALQNRVACDVDVFVGVVLDRLLVRPFAA